MDLMPQFSALTEPNDILALKKHLTEMADELDIIYTTTAPDGAISARQGRRAIYKNGSNYEEWINTTGLTTWVRVGGSTNRLWEVDGTETQLATADEIDMQSKNIINVADPASAQDAMTKAVRDADLNTPTAHDHDGADSKKILYTNLDLTGITNEHYLYSNAGAPAGKAISVTEYSFLARVTVDNGAGSAVTCDETGGFDTNGNFSSSKFTAPVTGRYQFNVSVNWTKDGTTTERNVKIGLRKNGTTIVAQCDLTSGMSGASFSTVISVILSLSATDYIELMNVASDSCSIVVNNLSLSWFSGALIPNAVS